MQTPDKILGVPGPKKFRMPWIITQKQIFQKALLAKCNLRKRGGMAPIEGPEYIYIYIYIYTNIYIHIYIYTNDTKEKERGKRNFP